VFKRNHATKLGKRKKKFEKGFFLCCVFMKGQTLKLGSLGRTLEGSLKKKTSKVSLVHAIIHGCVLLGSIGVCGHDFFNFVGVPSHCSPWLCWCW
jgi:hypothetical protein